uniref:Protein asteroid n=1 Tax=Lygus hesperus TaxID=30085 RepID=A0A0K8T5C4_LYGHE
MGVTGLTKYIYYREHIYFEEVILKDCALIVDGNSLAPHLYNSHLIHTSAFGGDYDKLGEITERFFKRLLFNNVYPIVVFDGAVEKRKVSTVKTRARNKVCSLQSITPFNCNGQCFPLLMRKAMREKLMDMGIVVLQTDLEADSEIAALAKIYHAPVLSNDSDYFIFDVLYIPIPTLIHHNGTNSKIRCKIFKKDKFVRHLNLDRAKLPLLAVVLGNDYIPRSAFRSFLGQIKLDRSRQDAYSQKVIAGMIRWLKAESVESALHKILSCMRSRARQALRQKIIKIMRGYTNLTTVLENYIPNNPKIKPFLLHDEFIDEGMNNLNLESEEESDFESGDEQQAEETGAQEEKDSSLESNSYCSSVVDEAERDFVNESEVEQILKAGKENESGISQCPSWLLKSSRKGLVPPDVLTILNLKTYFSTPQPECYEMSYSGEPYTHLLQCIAGILLGKDEVQYWHRQHRNKYERKMVETVSGTVSYGIFPPLEQIGKLSLEERRTIFNEVMNVEESYLKNVPNEWKLYFISVSYWLLNDLNQEIKPYHLHSVIMMMVTLLVLDKNIGFHRQRKTFIKTYGSAVSRIARSRQLLTSPVSTVLDNLTEALRAVTREDCILIFDGLLPNFQVDRQIQHSKHFSNGLVHSFARLQSCLAFTTMLNAVLASPYPDIKIHNFYDGTFLYNIAGNLKKRANIMSYIDSFFMKTPTLLAVYRNIFETYQKFYPLTVQKRSKRKSRNAKTAPTLSEKDKENIKFDSDSEPFFDKNNRFSIIFA